MAAFDNFCFLRQLHRRLGDALMTSNFSSKKRKKEKKEKRKWKEEKKDLSIDLLIENNTYLSI